MAITWAACSKGQAGQPYLVVTAEPTVGRMYALAIDAAAGTAACKVQVDSGVARGTSGQFPVIRDTDGEPVVVFRTDAGVVGVGR